MPYKDPEVRRAYMREYHKKWRAANPEKVKEYQRRHKFYGQQWRKDNPEKVRAYARKGSAKYRSANIETVRKRDLFYYKKGKYGITETQYHEMVVAQAGRCPICGDEFKKTPHIDHDHDSGEVRALLCGRCNVGIAMLRHDPQIIQQAGAYLS